MIQQTHIAKQKERLIVEKEIERLITITEKYSPKCFINQSNELILVPTQNVYFQLEDVNDEMDLKCKVISWLSRPSCKGLSNYWQKRVRNIFNEFLGTDFSKDEVYNIYGYLGNDVNRTLCKKFIESNYDLSVIN
jgi:hypothetical protein